MSAFKSEKEELLRSYDKTIDDSFMRHAIRQGKFDIVKSMIENGEYPDNNNFIWDVQLAEQLEQVWEFAPEKFFIEQNDQGNTIIHILARYTTNNGLIFKILSKYHTLLNTLNQIKNHRGDSLLMYCIKSFNAEMVKLLVSECGYQDLSTRDYEGRNTLMLAMKYFSLFQFQEAFEAETMKSRFSIDELQDLLNSKDNFGRSTMSFGIVEEVPNETIIYLLNSFQHVISLESKDSEEMNAFNYAFEKENMKILKAILNIYKCPGFEDCLTSNSPNDYKMPLHTTLVSINLANSKAMSNLIMYHNDDCGRAQIYSFLRNPSIMDDLVKGTKFELEAFLLKWNKSPRANLLHVATELGNVALMQEIFKKARIRNGSVEECVNIGKEESVQLAAEKLLLEPLDYLLDMDSNPAKTFKYVFETNENAQKTIENILHEAASQDKDRIFIWILASK